MSTTTLFPIAISSQLDETGVERVHAAPDNVILRSPYTLKQYVFVLLAETSELLVSEDGGITWPYTIDSGGPASSEAALSLSGGGGRLHRHHALGGRTCGLDLNFVDITGSFSGTGFPSWGIYTGTEWIRASAGGLMASSDGEAFSLRGALTSYGNGTYNVAKLDTNIVATAGTLTTAGARFLSSVNSGASFDFYASGRVYNNIIPVADGFLAFSGGSAIASKSPTGASGTWTYPYSTVGAPTPVHSGAYSPTLSKAVIIADGGAGYSTIDNGLNWVASGSVNLDFSTGTRNCMIWAFDKFILTTLKFGTYYIYTSPDGDTWTQRYSTTSLKLMNPVTLI